MNTPKLCKPLHDQRGVAFIIEIVLIAAVVAVIGLAVFSMSRNRAQQPTATPTPSATPQVSNDSTAGWKSYTSPKDEFSLKYPATWVAKYSPPQAEGWPEYVMLGVSSEALTAARGADAVGQMYVGFMAGSDAADIDTYSQYSYNTKLSERQVIIGKLEGRRVEWKINRSGLGAAHEDCQEGSRTVFYRLAGPERKTQEGYRSYIARYDYCPKGPLSTDVTADFDRMVDTLTVK